MKICFTSREVFTPAGFDDLHKVTRIVRKKPDSIIAKKRLVETYLAINDRKQAKQHIDYILKANSNDNDGLFFRGRLSLADDIRNKLLKIFPP